VFIRKASVLTNQSIPLSWMAKRKTSGYSHIVAERGQSSVEATTILDLSIVGNVFHGLSRNTAACAMSGADSPVRRRA
jgi:hypothetical protein